MSNRKVRPSPPVDDEGQVTPHADGLSEAENASSGAASVAAQVAAALAAGGYSRTADERGLARDRVDLDVGLEEALRSQQGRRGDSATSLESVLNSIAAQRAQDSADLSNFIKHSNAFWHSLSQANGVFNNSLLQDESVQTDNETITVAQLAVMVQGLAAQVAKMTD